MGGDQRTLQRRAAVLNRCPRPGEPAPPRRRFNRRATPATDAIGRHPGSRKHRAGVSSARCLPLRISFRFDRTMADPHLRHPRPRGQGGRHHRGPRIPKTIRFPEEVAIEIESDLAGTKVTFNDYVVELVLKARAAAAATRAGAAPNGGPVAAVLPAARKGPAGVLGGRLSTRKHCLRVRHGRRERRKVRARPPL